MGWAWTPETRKPDTLAGAPPTWPRGQQFLWEQEAGACVVGFPLLLPLCTHLASAFTFSVSFLPTHKACWLLCPYNRTSVRRCGCRL